MIYFIFDNPLDKDSMSFLDKFPDFCPLYPQSKLISVNDQLKFSRYVLKHTNDNDVLIFWYDFLGVLTAIKNKKKSRKIIVLNILLKNKKTIKNRIARILYKTALNKRNVLYTVTSEEYGEWCKSTLKLFNKPFLLHDPYHKKTSKPEAVSKGYCFCGGRNGRDWKLMFEIARRLPDVQFHFVMSDSDYFKFRDEFSSNVLVRTSISIEEFNKELHECAMVTMPVNTEAPAGLLAFYEAANAEKMVMTNSTMTNREYFSNDRGVLCESIDDWVDKICIYLNDKEKSISIAKNFKKFLEDKCFENIYAEELLKICREEINR